METITHHEQPKTGIRIWQHCSVFLVACAVIVSRRPDAVFHAQFWCEDGHVFFADAYNFGWWAALFRIYQGYLHGFPRLGAALALLFPFSLAPLVLNLASIGVQALPTNLLLSSRSSAWGKMPFRALLACVYLILPNSWEITANVTNSQWLLTLNAFLVLVAFRPRGVTGRFFDLCILLICGLTGPFCIFLFPIGVFLAWRRRDRWQWTKISILAVTCSVQAWGLVGGGFSSRPHFALGANPALLVRILSGHVFLGTLLGENTLAANSSQKLLIILFAVAVGGIAVVALCLPRSPEPMRLLVSLASMLLASSLIAPTAYPPAGLSVWEMLAGSGGIRYWYFPSLAFAWLLLYGIQSRAIPLRTASAVLSCIMCFGIFATGDVQHSGTHISRNMQETSNLHQQGQLLPFRRSRPAGTDAGQTLTELTGS